MMDDSDLLPDGTRFDFWDDQTEYARVFHVAQEHHLADDANQGSADRPFATISRAAEILQPGEKVLVHGGVYRECIRLRLPDDGDPRDRSFEVTTREQLFVPRERGAGYIRVSGFTFEHAADPVPSPWRGMVSAWRGHHWIIEDCSIRWANAVGIDVGNEAFGAEPRTERERWVRHIIRRNRISDCGICGIAAIDANWGTLVEDNIVERIGPLALPATDLTAASAPATLWADGAIHRLAQTFDIADAENPPDG
jgi:hypothetical protein